MAHHQDGPPQIYLRKTSTDRTDRTMKVVKGSAIVKQLPPSPLADYQPLLHEFLDEHIMSMEEARSETMSDEWKL
ncbi:hypothetical protein CR513_52378, partial [Mucuna pruriens]